MELATSKPRKKHSVALIILVSCILLLAGGQVVPVYFVDPDWRFQYYLVICILLVLTTPFVVFRRVYNPDKDGDVRPVFMFFMTAVCSLFFFGILMMGILSCSWKEVRTYYFKKDNPQIKIIRRYTDSGILEWGNSGRKFQTALQRPFLSAFKIETPIDTAFVDKRKWKKAGE